MVTDRVEIGIGLRPIDGLDPQRLEGRLEHVQRRVELAQFEDERAREVVAQVEVIRIEQQRAFRPLLRALGLAERRERTHGIAHRRSIVGLQCNDLLATLERALRRPPQALSVADRLVATDEHAGRHVFGLDERRRFLPVWNRLVEAARQIVAARHRAIRIVGLRIEA